MEQSVEAAGQAGAAVVYRWIGQPHFPRLPDSDGYASAFRDGRPRLRL
jgi:hypothetical protein